VTGTVSASECVDVWWQLIVVVTGIICDNSSGWSVGTSVICGVNNATNKR